MGNAVYDEMAMDKGGVPTGGDQGHSNWWV